MTDRANLWFLGGIIVIILLAVIWKLNHKPSVPNLPQTTNTQQVESTYPTNTLPSGGKG